MVKEIYAGNISLALRAFPKHSSCVKRLVHSRPYKVQRDIALSGNLSNGHARLLPASESKHGIDAPLSSLPFTTLYRSLFVNAISSKPLLLSVALPLLRQISTPGNNFLFNLKKNKPLAWLIKRTVYKQFCAGEEGNEVKRTLKSLRSLGFRGTILTYGKETVFNHSKNSAQSLAVDCSGAERATGHCPHIQAWRDGIMETIDMLGDGDQLAIK